MPVCFSSVPCLVVDLTVELATSPSRCLPFAYTAPARMARTASSTIPLASLPATHGMSAAVIVPVRGRTAARLLGRRKEGNDAPPRRVAKGCSPESHHWHEDALDVAIG